MLTKEQAKKLAVRYQAYLEASQSDDHRGIVVWGTLLLEVQDETGVEMLEPELLLDCVAYAERQRAAA